MWGGGDKTVWPGRVVLPLAHQEGTSSDTRAEDMDLGASGSGRVKASQ